MSESEKVQLSDGFNDTPGMVPGAEEVAQQIDPQLKKPKSQRKQLVFAVLGLLFAGGWGYANQNDLKMALGYQAESNYAGSEGCCAAKSAGCCPSESGDETLAAMDENGHCPLMAAQIAAGENSPCCAEGQQAALAAALLKQPQPEIALVEEATETEEESAVPAAENSAATEAASETGSEVKVETETEAETVEAAETVETTPAVEE